MDKRFATDLILIVLVAILLLTIGYGTYIYDRDKLACVSNPVVYAEETYNLSCQCREYQGFRSTDLKINFSGLR